MPRPGKQGTTHNSRSITSPKATKNKMRKTGSSKPKSRKAGARVSRGY